MHKKGITCLAIPPKNKRGRYIRFRFSVLIFLGIIFLGGVAGFFIPFNALTLDVVEVNQKRNITDQNRKLLGKIRTMRETLFLLKSKVDTLKQTKENIAELIDIDSPVTRRDPLLQKKIEKMELDDILSHVNATELFFNDLKEKIKRNPSYIHYVPVVKPVVDEYVITARFGRRKDPFTGDIKRHNGVDFSAERETPVIAAASGTVNKVENHNYWGRRVSIQHRYGFSTVYAHLGTVKVHKGQNVKRGDVIATIGISGLASGPHLHYEIHHYDSPVDPELYFFPENITVAAVE